MASVENDKPVNIASLASGPAGKVTVTHGGTIREQLAEMGVLDAVDTLIAVVAAAQHRWAAGATQALAEARAAGLLEEDA